MSIKAKIVSREEWLAARLGLLKEEKELTRRSDELARRRQALRRFGSIRSIDSRPMRECLAGRPLQRTLAAPRLPLHVRARLHGGVSANACSSIADSFNGVVVHLKNHDVAFFGGVAEPAPLAKLQAYKKPDGVETSPRRHPRSAETLTSISMSRSRRSNSARGTVEYNYRKREPEALTDSGIGDSLTKRGEEPVAEHAAMTGTDVATYTREKARGMSAFVLRGWRRLPYLLRLLARTGWPLGHVPVA